VLFVVSYIFQYWAYITYAMWLVFGEPSVVIMVATVIFINQGGVLNMLAYTLLRRMSLGVQSESQGAVQPRPSTRNAKMVKTQKF